MAIATRRQVIGGAGALGFVATAPALAQSVVTPIHLAAFDSRHSASLAFAAEAHRLGMTTRDTGRDITSLYTDEWLDNDRAAPVAVAGLTPVAQLFCLRLVVERPRLRLVFLQLQDEAGAAFGPAAVRPRLAGLQRTAAPPVAAARLFATWRPGDATVATSRSDILAADARAIDSGTLVAWLLAPVRRSSKA